MAGLTFNEAALHFLLEDEAGPVGLRLQLVSETIQDNYQAAVGNVWENQPASIIPVIGTEISSGQFGLQAEIGIVDPGIVRSDGRPTISEVIADKFQNRESDKFVPRIMAGWDDQL